MTETNGPNDWPGSISALTLFTEMVLADRGVTLLNGPVDRPWGIRTAGFRDPGGHIREIAR
ncbi:hypothetical protein OG912_08485 [Streptomyces sp. NBC_00464]|uniref:hypothetical protein n=1 Tax=Streptomyces sp. NBC_00464 TaxID=2975751 RepID=UPI002E179042